MAAPAAVVAMMSYLVGPAGTVASATKCPIGSSRRLTRMVGGRPGTVMPTVTDAMWISLVSFEFVKKVT